MADPRRRLRAPALTVAVASLGLAALLVVAWLVSPHLIAGSVTQALGVRGVEDVSLRVERPAWGSLVLYDIEVGEPPEVEIVRAEIAYSWKGLLARRLESVELSGVAVRASFDEDGLRMDLLEAWQEESQAHGPDLVQDSPTEMNDDGLPLDRLSVRGIRADITTPWGSLVVDGSAELRGSALTASLGLETVVGDATARLHLVPLAPETEARPPASGPESRARWLPVEAEGSLEIELRDWRADSEAAPVSGRAELPLRVSSSGVIVGSAGTVELETPRVLSVRGLDATPLWVVGRPEAGVDKLEGRLRAGLQVQAPWPGLAAAAGTMDATVTHFRETGGDESQLESHFELRLETRGLNFGGTSLERAQWVLPGRAWKGRTGQTTSESDWEFECALESAQIEAEVSRGEAEPIRVSGSTPTVDLAGSVSLGREDTGAALSGRILTRGGVLEVHAGGLPPDLSDLTVAGVGFSGTWSARAGGSVAATGRLDVERTGWTSPTPMLSPFGITGEVSYEQQVVDFDLTLGLRNVDVSAGLRGRHDVDIGEGRARFTLRPVTWSETRRIREALPVLEGLIDSASGDLGAGADLRWGSGLQASAAIDVQGFGLAKDSQVLEGLVGKLQYQEPVPPAGEVQTLRADRVVAGDVEFAEPILEYRQTQDRGVLIERADWSMFGGRFLGKGVIDLEADEQWLNFQVERLKLAQVLEFLDFDGVTGTGKLAGTIPVVRQGDRIEIRSGELSAGKHGGWLRFAPGSIPGLGQSGQADVDRVGRVLENFRYDELEIRIDGEVTGTINVSLHLFGTNPDLSGGQTFDLTLNNEVPLGDIVRAMTIVTRIPEEISRRLRHEP